MLARMRIVACEPEPGRRRDVGYAESDRSGGRACLRYRRNYAPAAEIEDHAWIEAAAAGGHDQPVKRTEASGLVATLRPSFSAQRLAPEPRCAAITRPRAKAGEPLHQHASDVFVGQAVKAVAAHACCRPLLAEGRIVQAAGGSVWWNAVSKQATCLSDGRAAAIACIGARLSGMCSGSSGVRPQVPPAARA